MARKTKPAWRPPDPLLSLRSVLDTASTRGWNSELHCEGCFSTARGIQSGLWTLFLMEGQKQILVTHAMGLAPKVLAQLGAQAKSELDNMFSAE